MNNKPIRILCVFRILNRGGSESMCMNLYRNIDRTKVQFDFVKHSSIKGSFEDEIISLGGRIYEAPEYNFLNHFQYISWWNNHLKQHPEHMIVHGHYTTLSALYLGVANKMGRITIGHSHSDNPKRNSLADYLKAFLLSRVEKEAKYCFACGQKAGEWLFPHRKFKVLNNAIDTKMFVISEEKRSIIRQEFGIGQEFVIGHVGNLLPVKNHSFLLEVFEHIREQRPNSKLVLVGGGSQEELKKLSRSLGISRDVIFTGARSDVSDILQSFDVFAFPSISEGLPVTAIEAQAAGLYCFFSEAVTKEVDLTGRCEFLPIDDPKLWAEKILNTDLTKADTSEQIKAAGYDIHTTAKWLERFYLKISERG